MPLPMENVRAHVRKYLPALLVSERGSNEPRHEKTCLRGLRPGKSQSGLLSYSNNVEPWNFGYGKYR